MLEQFFHIPDLNWVKFLRKMQFLKEKADKIGVPPVSFKIIEEYKDRISATDRTLIGFKKIIVSGLSPKLSGWEFVAKLEPMEEVNYIKSVPGAEVPEKYRAINHLCDHCKLTKTNRKAYYLLKSDERDYVKIGSSCIKDFLGHGSPEAIASYLSHIFETKMDEFEDTPSGSIGRKDVYLPVEEIFSVAARMMRGVGYRKKSDFGGGTADDVADYLIPQHGKEAIELQRALKEKYPVDQLAQDIASGAMAWFLSLPEAALNNYTHNVVSCIKAQEVTIDKIGVLASAVWFYEKDQLGREAEKKAEKSNEYLGAVGEKVSLSVIYKSGKWFESSYNPKGSFLLIFEDLSGNTVTWTTSSVMDQEEGLVTNGFVLDPGKTFKLDGTVKGHRDYNGKKQTSVIRCKIAEISR